MSRRLSRQDDRVHGRIAMLRAERGMTRQELADAVGIHYQTVGYLERGEYAPSLAVALRLARLFGVPVEALFSLDPFPPLTGDQLTGGTHDRPFPDRVGPAGATAAGSGAPDRDDH
jgi:putative transcriptional regulator